MCIVFLGWEVELGQSKINNLEGLCLWVDQYVKRLDVSVHNPLRMNIVETLT